MVTGDSSGQVGLNIPLHFIFKPSYSPHCINTNVGGHYFFMKILLTIIALATVCTASGQEDNQKDLVDILNIALRDSILPTELIVTKNSKSTPWTNAPFIVVRADKEKKLNRLLNPPANNHVWISDYEEIFELAIPFGLIPLKITRKKNRLTLDYKTVKYPSKDGANTCHTGRLIADREGDMWIIVDSKVKETKCETDTYGLKK